MAVLPLLSCESLTIGYPQGFKSHVINWSISDNQHWIISGPNGAGKTTLIKTILGKIRPLSGVIKRHLDNPYDQMKYVSFTDSSKLFHSVNNVHYYQQRFNSWDSDGHITVENYLETGGFQANNADHLALLKDLQLDALLKKERIKLSSGQTRKMLIAKALVQKPKLLFLDNLYIGLDADSRDLINDMLDRIVKTRGMNLIISGHFTSLPSCVNRQIHIDFDQSHTSKLSEQRKPEVHLNITEQPCLTEIARVWKTLSIAPAKKEIFEFREVDISYGEQHIVNHINWKVLAGDKWNLKGNNGSGKSTLVSLIYGDNPQAYAKSVFVFGQRRGQGESIWDIKSKIGFTSPELHAYFRHRLSSEEVVWSGLNDRFEPMVSVPSERIKMSDLFFEYFNLDSKKEKLFHTLSTGQQRMVLFIRALIKSPAVLLLDEPFQGFDPENVIKAKTLLEHTLTENDTLLFISHFTHEVPRSVDKVFVVG